VNEKKVQSSIKKLQTSQPSERFKSNVFSISLMCFTFILDFVVIFVHYVSFAVSVSVRRREYESWHVRYCMCFLCLTICLFSVIFYFFEDLAELLCRAYETPA